MRNVTEDCAGAGTGGGCCGVELLYGIGTVSAQYGSIGTPFTATMYIGFTWMWNGCRMLFMLTIVHSSTLSSATVCVSAFDDWNGM